MRASSICMAGLVGFAGWLAGCHAPPEPTGPTVTRVSAPTEQDYDRLWDSVGDTLRRNYWELDRQDRIEGVITTFPETTANSFEIWRPQPKPAYYYAEANLATIQRKVTVKITPIIDQAGSYDLGVQIDRLRYSLEEHQVDNSAAAFRIYSRDTPTVEGRRERAADISSWIPLGRDKPLEDSVLAAILRRYAKTETTGVQTQPACETITTRPE
jgi:hypothetical protein